MKSFLLPVSFTLICACVPVQMTQPSNVLIDMGQIETANDGRCYANDISPAVIETVIIQEIESPEVRDANGQVTPPCCVSHGRTPADRTRACWDQVRDRLSAELHD